MQEYNEKEMKRYGSFWIDKREQGKRPKGPPQHKKRYVSFIRIKDENPFRTVPGQAYTRPEDEVIFFNSLDFSVEFMFPQDSPFENLPPDTKRELAPMETSESFIVIHPADTEIVAYQYLVHNKAEQPSIRIIGMSDPDVLIDP